MDILQQVIERIPAWQGKHDIQIERIAGLTNQNYLLTLGSERFVLRISGENTSRLGIDRRHELAALQAAELAGIGPEVVAFLEPQGHLVTRWIDGCHWQASEFRTPEHVRLLTETVKYIHIFSPNGAAFSPFQRVTAYLGAAQRYNVPLPSGFDAHLETMRRVEVDQQNDPSSWLRFCHNDLVSVNYLFVEQERSIKILDWEFAGMGDIYYDLATLVYTHDSDGPIPPDLEQVMLTCYFGETTAWHARRLLGMKYMFLLFSGMWGLVQYGLQQTGKIPAPQGFDYLEYAQYLFVHDIQELQTQLNEMADA
jgi:thiamine kinase-like enzyme